MVAGCVAFWCASALRQQEVFALIAKCMHLYSELLKALYQNGGLCYWPTSLLCVAPRCRGVQILALLIFEKMRSTQYTNEISAY